MDDVLKLRDDLLKTLRLVRVTCIQQPEFSAWCDAYLEGASHNTETIANLLKTLRDNYAAWNEAIDEKCLTAAFQVTLVAFKFDQVDRWYTCEAIRHHLERANALLEKAQ